MHYSRPVTFNIGHIVHSLVFDGMRLRIRNWWIVRPRPRLSDIEKASMKGTISHRDLWGRSTFYRNLRHTWQILFTHILRSSPKRSKSTSSVSSRTSRSF